MNDLARAERNSRASRQARELSPCDSPEICPGPESGNEPHCNGCAKVPRIAAALDEAEARGYGSKMCYCACHGYGDFATCDRSAIVEQARAEGREAACPPTGNGHINHVEALMLVRAWLDMFQGSYSEGWTVPHGIGTVEETVSRALRAGGGEGEGRK